MLSEIKMPSISVIFFDLEASDEKLDESERQVSTELNENTALVVSVLQVRDSFL